MLPNYKSRTGIKFNEKSSLLWTDLQTADDLTPIIEKLRFKINLNLSHDMYKAFFSNRNPLLFSITASRSSLIPDSYSLTGEGRGGGGGGGQNEYRIEFEVKPRKHQNI